MRQSPNAGAHARAIGQRPQRVADKVDGPSECLPPWRSGERVRFLTEWSLVRIQSGAPPHHETTPSGQGVYLSCRVGPVPVSTNPADRNHTTQLNTTTPVYLSW